MEDRSREIEVFTKNLSFLLKKEMENLNTPKLSRQELMGQKLKKAKMKQQSKPHKQTFKKNSK